MRISKESSGGRGEYEWCDFQADDPSSADLGNRRIHIRLPDGNVVDTGSVFEFQGGKQRIRLAQEYAGQKHLYPHWHIAAALMLPRPSRDEDSWRAGSPIMRDSEYGIFHLHLGNINIQHVDIAMIEITRIEVCNQSGQQDIVVADRYAKVREICDANSRFDDDIGDLLRRHQQIMASGARISTEGLPLVAELQQLVSRSAADYGVIPNSPNTDALPTLRAILHLKPEESNLDPEAIPAEDIVLRRRTIAQQRRWAMARGASAVRFRRSVQRAYRFTCIVCGLRLPPVGSGGASGVDAAHILPYAQYDLDDVRNGICLCKIHHWAFDEALVHIRWNGQAYEITIPESARQRVVESGTGMSLDFLEQFAGPIDPIRLPGDPSEWPAPKVLEALENLIFG